MFISGFIAVDWSASKKTLLAPLKLNILMLDYFKSHTWKVLCWTELTLVCHWRFFDSTYRHVSNIRTNLSRQLNCWSIRCSWSIACRRCSNYICMLYLTPGFNRLGKDRCKTRREPFKFWDLVRLLLESLRVVWEWWLSSWAWGTKHNLQLFLAVACMISLYKYR